MATRPAPRSGLSDQCLVRVETRMINIRTELVTSRHLVSPNSGGSIIDRGAEVVSGEVITGGDGSCSQQLSFGMYSNAIEIRVRLFCHRAHCHTLAVPL